VLFAAVLLSLAASPGVHALSFFPGFLKEPDRGVTEEEKREIGELFADRILVKKSERTLYLIKDDKPFLSFPVSLGFSPEGHKERQGDGRTPEGRYLVDWRKPSSKFYKSLHISYPNAGDLLRARRRGVDPGGLIMIHGQPRPSRRADLQAIVSKEDWTQGCIAVSNYAIDEIWERTNNGTIIEILP
jgi:murein L,D-transpeptidase YafK